MADRVWIGANDGDWSDPANWQGTIVPGPGDDVTIQSTLAETITISTSETIASLVFDDPAATLEILNTGTVFATGNIVVDADSFELFGQIDSAGELSVTATGTIDLEGTADAQTISLQNEGSFNLPTLTLGTLVAGTVVPTGTILGTLTTGTSITLGATTGTIVSIVPTGSGQSGGIVVYSDNNNTDILPCFAAGTCIETDRGPVAVENLTEGDRVLLISGSTAPIAWIGRRHVDLRRHPAHDRVRPIRIAPHAFGLGRPRRPLFLSPDHSVFVEDVLIPVKFLINDTTITQVEPSTVTYYHVELAHHDVVLAEGLPVETYLETGGRSAFENGGTATQLHPDFEPDDTAVGKIWQDQAYAPLIGQNGELDRVRLRLALQAELLAPITPRAAIRA